MKKDILKAKRRMLMKLFMKRHWILDNKGKILYTEAVVWDYEIAREIEKIDKLLSKIK